MSIRNFVKIGYTVDLCRQPWLMKDYGMVCASNGLLLASRKVKAGEQWPEATENVVKAFKPLLETVPKKVIRVNTAKLREWAGMPDMRKSFDEYEPYPTLKPGLLHGVRINRSWIALLLEDIDEEVLEIGHAHQTTGKCLFISDITWKILLMALTVDDKAREKKNPLPVFVG